MNFKHLFLILSLIPMVVAQTPEAASQPEAAQAKSKTRNAKPSTAAEIKNIATALGVSILVFATFLGLKDMQRFLYREFSKATDEQLYSAVQRGRSQDIHNLVRRGANPNHEHAFHDEGEAPLTITPLESALGQPNDSRMVGALLRAGALPNKPDQYGITPLSKAARKGNIYAFRQILSYCTHKDVGDELLKDLDSGYKMERSIIADDINFMRDNPGRTLGDLRQEKFDHDMKELKAGKTMRQIMQERRQDNAASSSSGQTTGNE